MTEQLDWDAGVTSKHHKSGIWVNMYKNKPGIFYDNRGGVVPESIAQDCGFDVKKLKLIAERKSKVDSAMKDIEAEFSASDDREVIFQRGDYMVIAGPKGTADIIDIDGNAMNTVIMKKSEAVALAKELTKNVIEPEESNPPEAP